MTGTIVEITCDVLGKVKWGVDNDNGLVKDEDHSEEPF